MNNECKDPHDQEEGPILEAQEYKKAIPPGSNHINVRMSTNLACVRRRLGEINNIITLFERNPNPSFGDLHAVIRIRKCLNEGLLYEDKEPEYPNYSKV